MESDPFLIDNTPPAITGLKATRGSANLEVHWKAADALNEIRKAEYSLDGGEWTIVAPAGRLSDSMELDYDLVLKVTDETTGQSVERREPLAILPSPAASASAGR